MSRRVTASREIKINMSTRDDINIEVKEAVHTAWPGLALLGNKPSLLIIITKALAVTFTDQQLYMNNFLFGIQRR